jgi:hypothetical protein
MGNGAAICRRWCLALLVGATSIACKEKGAEAAAPPAQPAAAVGPQWPRQDEPPVAVEAPARSPLAAAKETPAGLETGKFNSAQACGACHQAIFAKWTNSMHSNSYLDPVFRNALFKAHYLSQGKAAPTCLRCHSPTVAESKDFYGVSEITREGVTCDFCHSIGALEQDTRGVRYQIDWSEKHGPYSQTASPVHKTGFRPFFEKSEICAGCHDMTMPDGTVVFSTYSEWKASRYAGEGRQCHDCHMPRLAGATVKTGLNVKGHDVINDHQLLGGHEPTQVKRAVTVKVESMTRDGDRVRAVVAVENSGAGHYVPTGIPSRKLVLTVTARQRRRAIFQRELVYQRVMQAEDNRTLTEDWEIKLLSKRCLRDNRLAPLEIRRETFVFDASPDDDVDLAVRLTYVHGPTSTPPSEMTVEIAELDQVLARGL